MRTLHNKLRFSVRLLWLAAASALLVALIYPLPAAHARQQQPVGQASSETITVRAYSSQPRNSVGAMIPFTIEVQGSTAVESVDLDNLSDALRIAYRGSSQGSSMGFRIVNGRRVQFQSVSTRLDYAITPLRAGRFTIPSIELEIEGGLYRTNPVVIDVVGPRERTDIRAELEVDHARAFVGQPITLSLHVDSIPELLSVPAILSPEALDGAQAFTLPVDKVSADPTSDPSRQAMEQPVQILTNTTRQLATTTMLGAEAYLKRSQVELLDEPALRWTLRVVLLPTTTGTITLQPMTVRLEVSRGTRPDVFNRPTPVPEVVIVETGPIRIDVLPLPEDPSPISETPWDQSRDIPVVGRFTIEARATPSAVNVGDPIELLVTVDGWEPLERLGRLDLRGVDGFAHRFRPPADSVAPERDNLSLRFMAQIRATSEQADSIPPIRFRAFDPIEQTWNTIASEPVPLQVRPTRVIRAGDVATLRSGPAGEALSSADTGPVLGTIDVDPSILEQRAFTFSGIVRSPIFVASVSLPPVACLGMALAFALGRHARARSMGKTPRDAVRKAVGRLHALPAAAEPRWLASEISAALRQFVVDGGMSELDPPASIASVLDACDAVRFGGDTNAAHDLRQRALNAIQESQSRTP